MSMVDSYDYWIYYLFTTDYLPLLFTTIIIYYCIYYSIKHPTLNKRTHKKNIWSSAQEEYQGVRLLTLVTNDFP